MRKFIQISFISITAFFVYAPFIISERNWAEGLCPLGGLETLPYLLSSGVYLKHTSSYNIGIMTALIIVTLLFGRIFCSFICPLGSLQEWIGALGKRLGIRKQIPQNLDKVLVKIKYLILLIILVATYYTADLVFRSYDPFYALLHFHKPVISSAFLILGLTLVGSLFFGRVWCKYLCPLGAFVNIASYFSLVKPTRDLSECNNCKRCDKACPENMSPSRQQVFLQEGCTHCLDCIDACPSKQQSIQLHFANPFSLLKKRSQHHEH